MASAAADPELSVTFHDPVWIRQRGGMLAREAALEYFRMSPFHVYDRDAEYTLDAAVRDPAGRLFCVKKVRRGSGKVVAAYYILDGVIYRAPDLRSTIVARLRGCAHELHAAFVELSGSVRYGPRTGYMWAFGGSSSSSSSEVEGVAAGGEAAEGEAGEEAAEAAEGEAEGEAEDEDELVVLPSRASLVDRIGDQLTNKRGLEVGKEVVAKRRAIDQSLRDVKEAFELVPGQ